MRETSGFELASTAQEIEIDVFTENPLDLNYLMAVFDEAVEQKT